MLFYTESIIQLIVIKPFIVENLNILYIKFIINFKKYNDAHQINCNIMRELGWRGPIIVASFIARDN